jgi:squalene-hopene/tetraprenyl-beta-curcumene cyclase
MRKILMTATALLVAGVAMVQGADGIYAQAQASTARGLAWLATKQQPDGAFGKREFPALTGLPLWAFAVSGEARYTNQADRAVAFILTCVQTNGGIYAANAGQRATSLATYNTAICMIALHATGRKDLTPVILRAREFLASSQLKGDSVHEGGFGYERGGSDHSDLMNTHFALQAMRETQELEDLRPSGQKRVDINWDKALQYVSRLQYTNDASSDDHGGFAYNPADPKANLIQRTIRRIIMSAYGSITYAGLLSMVYAQVDAGDPRVRSMLDWAAKHWSLEENPGMGDTGLFFFYNVLSRALDAGKLDAIPRKDQPAITWRNELAARLIGMQKPEGFWVNKNGRFWENDPVLTTAYAILALQHAQKPSATGAAAPK